MKYIIYINMFIKYKYYNIKFSLFIYIFLFYNAKNYKNIPVF